MPTISAPKSLLRIALGCLLMLDLAHSAGNDFLTTKEIRLEENLGARPFPKWSGGALLSLDSGGGESIGISVFDATGKKVSGFRFALPNVRYMNVRCYTRSSDGTIALGGSLVDQAGRSAPFLAMMDGLGGSLNVIRTNHFVAMHLAFADDATLWVGGYEALPNSPEGGKRTFQEVLNRSAGAVRQFSRSGTELKAVLPQEKVVDILPKLIYGETLFGFAGPELHWFSAAHQHYLKVSPDGNFEIHSAGPLPNNERAIGLALHPAGEIFAYSSGRTTWSVSRLDPRARAWQPVRSAPTADKSLAAQRLQLIGAEEDTVVSLSMDAQSLLFLKWTGGIR